MPKKEIYKIALRIASLFLLITALRFLPTIMATAMMPTIGGLIIVAMFVIYIVVAILLFVFSSSIARLVVGLDKETSQTSKTPDYVSLAFALAGIFIISNAIIDLPVAIGALVESFQENTLQIMGVSKSTTSASFIGALLQLAFGLFLFLKSKAVAKYFEKISS